MAQNVRVCDVVEIGAKVKMTLGNDFGDLLRHCQP